MLKENAEQMKLMGAEADRRFQKTDEQLDRTDQQLDRTEKLVDWNRLKHHAFTHEIRTPKYSEFVIAALILKR
jgi:hypothetical protein